MKKYRMTRRLLAFMLCAVLLINSSISSVASAEWQRPFSQQEIEQFTTDDIEALTAEQIATFTADHFAAMTLEQLEAFRVEQLEAMETAQYQWYRDALYAFYDQDKSAGEEDGTTEDKSTTEDTGEGTTEKQKKDQPATTEDGNKEAKTKDDKDVMIFTDEELEELDKELGLDEFNLDEDIEDIEEEDEKGIEFFSGDLEFSTKIHGTKITMSGPKSAFPEGKKYEVSAKELSAEALVDVEKALYKVEVEENKKIGTYQAYDIKLVVDGKVVQPEDDVTVTFEGGEVQDQIEGKKEKNVEVYYVNEDKQEATPVENEVETAEDKESVAMTTDHFSTYVITTSEPKGVQLNIEHYIMVGSSPDATKDYKIYQDTKRTVHQKERITDITTPSNYTEQYVYQVNSQGQIVSPPISGDQVLTANMTYRVYYKETTEDVKGPVQMFDYTVAPSDYYQNANDLTNFKDGGQYKNHDYIGYGINAESNYPSGYDEDKRLGMGGTCGKPYQSASTNLGSQYNGKLKDKYGNLMYDQADKNKGLYPAKITVTSGKSDGFVNAYMYEYVHSQQDYGIGHPGVITPGIIKGVDKDGNLDLNGGLKEPGFFTKTAKEGKTVLENYKLGFTRTGDKYSLNAAYDPNNKKVATVVKAPNTKYPNLPETSIDFFPLDDLGTSQDKANNGNKYSNNIHNDYFGMRYDIEFSIGEYIGDMNYHFSGDDDCWVVLDNNTVVLDCGGVHQPAEVKTDLWKVLLGNKLGSDYDTLSELDKHKAVEAACKTLTDAEKTAKHTITVLWMERGATDSNCYMEYVLPNSRVIDADDTPIDVTLKKVEAGKRNALKGAEFTLYTDNGSVLETGIKSDASGLVKVEDLYCGTYILKETKAPDDYMIIPNVYYKIVVTGDKDNKTAKIYRQETDDNGNDKGQATEVKPPSGSSYVEIPNRKKFEIPISGVKTNEKDEKLKGAEFKLFADADMTKPIFVNEGEGLSDEQKATITCDPTDGSFSFNLKQHMFNEVGADSTKNNYIKYELTAYFKETKVPFATVAGTNVNVWLDEKAHKLKFTVWVEEKADGSQEVKEKKIEHICPKLDNNGNETSTIDLTNCALQIDNNTFVFDYVNYEKQKFAPRISVSKTFEGLSLEEIERIHKQGFTVSVTGPKVNQDGSTTNTKMTRDLSQADVIRDANGNRIERTDTNGTYTYKDKDGNPIDKTTVATYSYIWYIEGLTTGSYKVEELNEKLPEYKITTTGIGNAVDVSEAEWELAMADITITECDKTVWSMDDNHIVLASLTGNGLRYLVYTYEPLTTAQQKAFIYLINNANQFKTFHTEAATEENTVFYYGDQISKANGGLTFRGNQIYVDENGLEFGKTKDWQHITYGTYSWTSPKLADLSVKNKYEKRPVDIDLKKLTVNGTEVSGAEFDLTRLKTDGTVDTTFGTNGTKHLTVDNSNIENEMKGLYAGVYKLEETKAPQGCSILTTPIYFKISYEIVPNTGTVKLVVQICDKDGKPATNAYAEIDGSPQMPITGTVTTDIIPSSTITLKIMNEVLYSLPSTGGMGIYWFMIFGVMFMTAAAAVFMQTRRREYL